MKIIQDAGQTAKVVQEYHIDEYFTAKSMPFQLRQYEKGEFLCSPFKPLEDFLFLVNGSVYLYDLRQNGGTRPIGIASSVTLFGDMEFATGMPSSFFAEVTENAECLALPMKAYRDALWADAIFLGHAVRALAKKMALNTGLDISSASLEEKVLRYMESQAGTPGISHVGKTAICLHCSRRQLQRVLKKLCGDGRIFKSGKGQYILR